VSPWQSERANQHTSPGGPRVLKGPSRGSGRNRGGREGAFQPEERGLQQVAVGLPGNPPLPKEAGPDPPPGPPHTKRASGRLQRSQPVGRVIGSVDTKTGVWLLLPAPQMRHVVGAAANRSRGTSVQKPVPRQRSGPAPWRSISHAARDGGVHRQPVRGERKQETAGDGGFGAREQTRTEVGSR